MDGSFNFGPPLVLWKDQSNVNRIKIIDPIYDNPLNTPSVGDETEAEIPSRMLNTASPPVFSRSNRTTLTTSTDISHLSTEDISLPLLLEQQNAHLKTVHSLLVESNRDARDCLSSLQHTLNIQNENIARETEEMMDFLDEVEQRIRAEHNSTTRHGVEIDGVLRKVREVPDLDAAVNKIVEKLPVANHSTKQLIENKQMATHAFEKLDQMDKEFQIIQQLTTSNTTLPLNEMRLAAEVSTAVFHIHETLNNILPFLHGATFVSDLIHDTKTRAGALDWSVQHTIPTYNWELEHVSLTTNSTSRVSPASSVLSHNNSRSQSIIKNKTRSNKKKVRLDTWKTSASDCSFSTGNQTELMSTRFLNPETATKSRSTAHSDLSQCTTTRRNKRVLKELRNLYEILNKSPSEQEQLECDVTQVSSQTELEDIAV